MIEKTTQNTNTSSSNSDTSSISFTALYTGSIWEINNLAPDFFSTKTGKFYYYAIAPFEFIGKSLLGGNIKTYLLQRHLLIDHILHRAIDHGYAQVLEIACGLSPRGLRLTQQYPSLRYVEADLEGMIDRKKHLFQANATLSKNHSLAPCNILDTDSNHSLEKVIAKHFDPNRPLIIITEGLINYFPLSVLTPFWERVRTALEGFPKGKYITDNYPLIKGEPMYRTLAFCEKALGVISKSQSSFHFTSDKEAIEHFNSMKFKHTACHNPIDYYQEIDQANNQGVAMPNTGKHSLVRIIEANTHQ